MCASTARPPFIQVSRLPHSDDVAGHGMKFVRNDGREFIFCQSKCRRHFNARHNPRKSKWTKAARKSSDKELCRDSIFNFEKRRNVPVRYNRELVVKTIKAMQIIDRIRERRKERFYLMRMRRAQERHMPLVNKALAKSSHLVNMLRINEKRRHQTISQKTKEIVAQAVEKEKAALLQKQMA